MYNKNHKNGSNIYDLEIAIFGEIQPEHGTSRASKTKTKKDDERTNGLEENFTKVPNDNIVEARVSWEPLKRSSTNEKKQKSSTESQKNSL